VNDDIGYAIKVLKRMLASKYGSDYTYIICGGSKAIAARTREEGDLTEAELKKVDSGRVHLEVK
jgi:hypothetical protein